MSDLTEIEIADARKPEGQRLKKPNSGLVLIPQSGQLRTVERKLFNGLLLCAQADIVKKDLLKGYMELEGKYLQALALHGDKSELTVEAAAAAKKHLDDLAGTHRFEMRYSSLSAMIAGSKLTTKLLEDYLEGLRKTSVIFLPPELKVTKDQRIWAASGLIELPVIEKRDDAIWVTWKLSPDIFRDVGDPSLYTLVDLQYQRHLSSYVAVALYEICLRYKNNHEDKGTGWRSPDWWAHALSRKALSPGRKKKNEADEPKFREWAKIKSESLVGSRDGKPKAIDEINEKTDIRITLEERLEGRRIVGVRFLVEKKRVELGPDADALSPELFERVTRIPSLGVEAVKDARREGRSEIEIFAALNQLESRLAREDLDPIQSVSAFFKSLLESNRRHISTVPAIETPKAEAPAAEEGPAISRRREVMDALEAMSQEELDAFCKKVCDELPKTTRSSSRVARTVMSRTWRSDPMVWANVQQKKGNEMFGEGWEKE